MSQRLENALERLNVLRLRSLRRMIESDGHSLSAGALEQVQALSDDITICLAEREETAARARRSRPAVVRKSWGRAVAEFELSLRSHTPPADDLDLDDDLDFLDAE